MPKDTMIYHFGPITNEAIGSDVADLDPLENKPMVPGHATLIAPPATIATGKVAVFNASTNKWSQVEDHRGKVFDTASGAESIFMKVGALPAHLTALPQPSANHSWDATTFAWVFDIAKAQAASIVQIKAAYQAALDAGVTYKAALFQSDAKSISTLTEVLTAISNGWPLPAGFAWIDAANTPHPASAAFLKGLSTALANHKAALFARLQIAKQAIAAAKTEATLNKIVF